MAEPEGLLVEGARLVTSAVRELWRRRAPAESGRLSLARVKPRLDLFVAALYAGAPQIVPTDPPPVPPWFARITGRAPRHLTSRTATAGTDGAQIWLPRTLVALDGDADALATYRLLAVEQAARAARGTSRRAPLPRPDSLERDLYLLAEAVAIDQEIARDFPGMGAHLRAVRAAALASRPSLERLTRTERAVECLVQTVLAANPLAPAAGFSSAALPPESRAWAADTARRVRAAGGRYRGVSVVPLWGQWETTPMPRGRGGDTAAADGPAAEAASNRSAVLRHRPAVRDAARDEDDARPGMWMVRLDEPMESVEDPKGLRRPDDQDDTADPGSLADALSDLPEARIVQTPTAPREVLESDGSVPRQPAARADHIFSGAAIVYPEWDCRLGAYRAHGAVVHPSTGTRGSGEWVDRVMARHAALVRQVRRRFDALRPRRVRLNRQGDGDDLDLSAYVTAFADRRATRWGDDRLYLADRPGRRDLAITLLIDVSASTDGWVGDSLRIIDVEKEALIVLLEALDALGDRHAVLSFSGRGPEDVRVLTIKAFEERMGTEIQRRIAALEPDLYTRSGAAIRHASARLAAERARHRLLLVLSDGKPNDIDEYEGRYGIEDTRQAVAEARLHGIVPFCLAVNREAPAYLSAVYGRAHTLLRRPELLPVTLMEVVRRLVAASA